MSEYGTFAADRGVFGDLVFAVGALHGARGLVVADLAMRVQGAPQACRPVHRQPGARPGRTLAVGGPEGGDARGTVARRDQEVPKGRAMAITSMAVIVIPLKQLPGVGG